MYCNRTLNEYLDDLAAKKPAPGGGSAAALTAALGASLISMVVNFTLGKPKYAAYQDALKALLDESEKLRKGFLDLTDKDVLAFQSGNIRDALDIPLMTCRLCFEAAKLCPPLITKGNRNLLSDVAVAAVFLESAFAAACFNVEINLKTLNDKKSTALIRRELSKKEKLIKKIRQETEEKVGKFIRG